MFTGDWHRFIATWLAFGTLALGVLVWVVWDLSANQTEQRIRGEQSTQNHIEYAEDRIDEKCLSLDPVPMRDCIHKEIESARDHARADQDLNAQQQMAFFTKIMGWTAGGGLVLGVVSIGVIFATLREMASTNRIMREEQRPWIIVDDNWDSFKKISSMFRSNPSLTFRVSVHNNGNTPAWEVSCTYITFSHDTLNPKEVSESVEHLFLNFFNISECATNAAFHGEPA